MTFDMPPDDYDRGDPHSECRHEIHRLQGIIAAIRAKLETIVDTSDEAPLYTPADMTPLIDAFMASSGPPESFWMDHLNAAFNKGKQIGFGEAARLSEGNAP